MYCLCRLCCSMNCWCVNVYCTTATGSQPKYIISFFSTLSHKRLDFWKIKVIKHKMCVLGLYTNFVWNISHSKRNWARYDKKYVYIGLRVQYLLFCEILFWQFFEKSSNIKLLEIPSSGSRVVPCGWTDRHEANRLFRNFA